MDTIGTISSVTTLPILPAPSSQGASVAVPDASAGNQNNNAVQASFDAQAAEQQRLDTIKRAAQDIANVYVVSDQRFTIYKDITGQYITRFTSLRNGKVTYIPEPELLKLGGGTMGNPPLFHIQA